MLKHAAAGHTRKEIASDTGISIHTVDFHLRQIFRKTGTRSITQALFVIRQNGLVAA